MVSILLFMSKIYCTSHIQSIIHLVSSVHALKHVGIIVHVSWKGLYHHKKRKSRLMPHANSSPIGALQQLILTSLNLISCDGV